MVNTSISTNNHLEMFEYKKKPVRIRHMFASPMMRIGSRLIDILIIFGFRFMIILWQMMVNVYVKDKTITKYFQSFHDKYSHCCVVYNDSYFERHRHLLKDY